MLKATKAPRNRVLVHALCAGLLDIGLGGGATTTPVFAISNSETTKQQMLRRELPKQAAPAGEQGYIKNKVVEEVSELPTTQQGAAPANLVKRLSLIEEDGSVERKTVAAVFQTVAATTQDGSAATSPSEADLRVMIHQTHTQQMKNAAGGGLADGAEHTIMGGNQKSIEHHVAVSARRSAMQETNYAPEGSMIQTKYKESMSSNRPTHQRQPTHVTGTSEMDAGVGVLQKKDSTSKVQVQVPTTGQLAASTETATAMLELRGNESKNKDGREVDANGVPKNMTKDEKKAIGAATAVGVAGGVLLLIIVSCLCYCFVCKGGGLSGVWQCPSNFVLDLKFRFLKMAALSGPKTLADNLEHVRARDRTAVECVRYLQQLGYKCAPPDPKHEETFSRLSPLLEGYEKLHLSCISVAGASTFDPVREELLLLCAPVYAHLLIEWSDRHPGYLHNEYLDECKRRVQLGQVAYALTPQSRERFATKYATKFADFSHHGLLRERMNANAAPGTDEKVLGVVQRSQPDESSSSSGANYVSDNKNKKQLSYYARPSACDVSSEVWWRAVFERGERVEMKVSMLGYNVWRRKMRLLPWLMNIFVTRVNLLIDSCNGSAPPASYLKAYSQADLRRAELALRAEQEHLCLEVSCREGEHVFHHSTEQNQKQPPQGAGAPAGRVVEGGALPIGMKPPPAKRPRRERAAAANGLQAMQDLRAEQSDEEGELPEEEAKSREPLVGEPSAPERDPNVWTNTNFRERCSLNVPNPQEADWRLPARYYSRCRRVVAEIEKKSLSMKMRKERTPLFLRAALVPADVREVRLRPQLSSHVSAMAVLPDRGVFCGTDSGLFGWAHKLSWRKRASPRRGSLLFAGGADGVRLWKVPQFREAAGQDQATTRTKTKIFGKITADNGSTDITLFSHLAHRHVCYSVDTAFYGDYFATGHRGVAFLWDMRVQQEIQTCRIIGLGLETEMSGAFTSASFSSGSTAQGQGEDFHCVRFHPTSEFLAAGVGARQLRLFDLGRSGRVIRTMPTPETVTALDFSFDGCYANAGLADGSLCVFDLRKNQLLSSRRNAPFATQKIRGATVLRAEPPVLRANNNVHDHLFYFISFNIYYSAK
eukprot:g16633.t1